MLYLTGAALLAVLLLQWTDWGWDRRLLALTFLVLPFHVIEEWVWPAGFHVQYNLLRKSDLVDRYPMNRLTDSITNYGAMLFGLALVALGGTAAVVAMLIFCLLEVVVHTLLGAMMLARFRAGGKRTIYGPGSVTTYLGFFPVAIGMIFYLGSIDTSVVDWLGGSGLLVLMLVLVIVLPEGLLKRRDSPYPFESSGYFARFLRSTG